MIKKIVLATDHAGFELKEFVKNMLSDKGIEIKDFGAFTYNAQDDYPDFILPAAQYIADNNLVGIIFGGSGQGEAIAANRIKGIRAAVFYNGPEEIFNFLNCTIMQTYYLSVLDLLTNQKLKK